MRISKQVSNNVIGVSEYYDHYQSQSRYVFAKYTSISIFMSTLSMVFCYLFLHTHMLMVLACMYPSASGDHSTEA